MEDVGYELHAVTLSTAYMCRQNFPRGNLFKPTDQNVDCRLSRTSCRTDTTSTVSMCILTISTIQELRT